MTIFDKTQIFFTQLKFGEINDHTSVTNILLIDSDVQNHQIFYDSVNTNTLPIIYSQNSNRDELNDYLKKFNNIQRIGIVFNDALIKTKIFMNNELFFTEKDITEQTDLSQNCQFMINLILQQNIQNIDFLVCNSLKHDNWKKYYDLLKLKTGVNVGASDNETGNVKYGGDWIMENTKENIQNIYWSNNIENYTQTLIGTIIISNTTITQAFADGYTWPVVVNTGVTITFGENLTFDSVSHYFIIDGSDVTIDGNNKIVTMSGVVGYSGLIRNGTNGSNGHNNTTVKNIGVETPGIESLGMEGGWICQTYFGKNASNCVVHDCYSTGRISNSNSGGICGGRFGIGGSCVIYNCYSTGIISGGYAGGICGLAPGWGNYCIIYNCYSTGNITNSYSGGICGSYAGYNGTCIIYNCYSIGELSGSNTGGICGDGAGYDGSCMIYNCYTTGTITGTNAGGICGSDTAISGSCIIYYCYSTGEILGDNTGGICGNNTGSGSGSCIIHSCNCSTTPIVGGGSFDANITSGISGSNTIKFFNGSTEINLPDSGLNDTTQTSITNADLKNLLNAPNKIIVNNGLTEIFNITINVNSPYLTAEILSEIITSDWSTMGDQNTILLDIDNHPIIGTSDGSDTDTHNQSINSAILSISINTLKKMLNIGFEITVLDIILIKGKYVYKIFVKKN